MFGTGGAALISKVFGEGDSKKANSIFSLVVYFSIIVSIVLAILGFIFIKPFCVMLGATGELLTDSLRYGRILLFAIPFFIIQYEFQCLFTAAEKPKLGLFITLGAGFTNINLMP